VARILALVEATIGPTLLLSSRLAALGHDIIVLSTPRDFRARTEKETFDWLVLDEAAVASRRPLLAHVGRHRHGARIAWLGTPPRRSLVPVDVVFAKPLQYGQLARFFSGAAAPRGGHAGPSSGDDPGGGPASERMGTPHGGHRE